MHTTAFQMRLPIGVCAFFVATMMVMPSRADDASDDPAQQAVTPPKHKRAQPRWDAAWQHSNAWDYVVTGVVGTAFTVELIALQNRQAPLRWTDPILFDTAVRSALRAPSQQTRSAVADATWALLGLQFLYPFAVDVPYAWARYGFGLARDLFWQDAATMFLAGAVDLGLRDLVGRARPETYDCIQSGNTNCIDGPETVRSFPGGHTVIATAASVLTCTQHLYVHLYGGPWDSLTCALTLASNMTLAFMRIIADEHWASDEIAGLAIGSLIGWGVPYLMHFRRHTAGADASVPHALVLPTVVPVSHGGGLGVAALF
jgi:membrane-associated phospholipid phosphatase